jgi:DNA polymerase-3 subunit epsilon
MAQNHFRQVVLDTETTGLSPEEGHRIIEIGCVELINRLLTQKRFHVYLNPDREIDAGAQEVHGISNEFLAGKPRFADIAGDFIAFIRGAELVIHNAPFDVGFINHEFSLLAGQSGDAPGHIGDYSTVFDTLVYARKKHPGQRNNLDALCKRYSIDNSHRELHGALLDAEILAEVFLLLTGGQASLLDDEESGTGITGGDAAIRRISADRPRLKVIRCNDAELSAHRLRLDAIEKAAGRCFWKE